ncbi:MAG: hypothetical protein JWN56_2935 [Sphingobacteriales bacterium]|nr:hypothetical protein [Sphingobacteriales bacterium]
MMNNTDEVNFWIFGQARIPMLAIMGCMLFAGLIAGFLLGRPKKKTITPLSTDDENNNSDNKNTGLSDEDREYIR